MSQSRQTRIFGPHRPEWQERLPKGLRIAAEWQFGTLVLAGIVSMVTTGNLLAVPVAFGISAMGWMFLTGFREDRRLESPVTWWAAVIFFSAIGLLVAVGLSVDPPD